MMVRTFVTGAALHIQHWSPGRNFAAVLWLIRCGARKPPRSPDHAPLPSPVWRDPNGAFVCLPAVARVLDLKPIRARPGSAALGSVRRGAGLQALRPLVATPRRDVRATSPRHRSF